MTNVTDGSLIIVGDIVMDFDGTETEEERKRLIEEAHGEYCHRIGVCSACGEFLDPQIGECEPCWREYEAGL